MGAATTTSVESPNGSIKRRKTGDLTEQEPQNGAGNNSKSSRKRPTPKYRHVAAVHAQTRPSCLSHDSNVAPSFLGFRNLMVIVLIVGNLRLMIENMQKVSTCCGLPEYLSRLNSH